MTKTNFTNINFEVSSFKDITFVKDIFENCNFPNCQIKDCNCIDSDFKKTIFDKYCFERRERGSLSKNWFESCHFLEIDFKNFYLTLLIQTTIENSKFSKSDQSINFQGKFFLIDILGSEDGINKMFLNKSNR